MMLMWLLSTSLLLDQRQHLAQVLVLSRNAQPPTVHVCPSTGSQASTAAERADLGLLALFNSTLHHHGLNNH